jgi:hypothetical protein
MNVAKSDRLIECVVLYELSGYGRSGHVGS